VDPTGGRASGSASPLVNRLLRGSLARHAAIDAATVAAALARGGAPGSHIHHNRELRRLAGS
jgi:hypothetical protein